MVLHKATGQQLFPVSHIFTPLTHPHTPPTLSPQPRIIAYATMGVIHASDWQLYLACSLIHMVGIVLGDRAVRFVNQRTFNHILLMLMLVCVALLFCAAFQVGHGGGSGGGGGEGGEAGADTGLPSLA